MKHIYRFLTLLSLLFILNNSNAQPWPNATWTSTGPCTGDEPDITKVYIDACFNPEQQNEFVYMKTGANGWNYTGFSMSGGSGQNATWTNLTTASNFIPASNTVINALNQGLGAACTAPNNTVFIAGANPLPANATIMVYPSSGPALGNLPAGSINYMCGKGPIYVITGNYVPGGTHGAFFRNGTTMGGFLKTTKFNFGPCIKTVNYNNTAPGQFPNDQGGNSIGAYVLGPGQNGAVGTSACFEVAPCVGPPPPTFASNSLSICESSVVVNTYQCTNCDPADKFSVFTNQNDPNSIIYTGTSFPPPGFLLGPPQIFPGTYTYWVEKVGICASTKVPITLNVVALPNNTPTPSTTTLTCANPVAIISAGGTAQGPNITYNWTGPNGFTSTSLTPTLTTGGLYLMTVTDNTTGCKKAVGISITDNTAFPVADAGPDKTITCINPGPFALGGSNTTSSGATYKWSNGPTTATQVVGSAGTYYLSVTNTASGCTKIDTVVVTQNNTAPTLSTIPSVTVNCTTPNPTLVATASGGTGLTYTWSGGSATTSASNPITTGGTYTVTVTNPANGCKTEQPIVVPQDKVDPTIAIAPPSVLTCGNNSTITLNTTGTSTGSNFTYNWSGPGAYASTAATPPNITVAGTYLVTVTNTTNGCTKTQSITVTEDKVLPTSNAGVDKVLNCINNQSVTIGGTSSTGANFTYLWSNGNTNATQTVTTPGTYKLTVTNTTNGCTKEDIVDITQNIQTPVISPIPPVTVNCTTPTPSLTTSVTGTNLVYTWSPSGSGANPTISVGGTYVLTVTNSVSGCTHSVTLTVPEDKVDPNAVIATPGVLTCTNNSTITLNPAGTSTGANFTYNWSGPGGYASTAFPPPNATVAGTYILTVTNTTNGCTKIVSSTVTENKTLPTADAGPDKILNCINNQSVTIGTGSQPSTTYLWSNGNTNATQTVTTPGTYSVTVTNTANGCTKEDVVDVTQNIQTPVISPIPPVTVNCTTPMPTLTTSVTGTNLVYAWSPSGSGANPTITVGGTYILTVTNSVSGCTHSVTLTVPEDKVNPTAVIATPGVLTCTNNSSIALNATGTSTGANFTYNWSGPGGYSSTALPPPNATVAGTYNLVVTNTTNGCTKTISSTVTENKTLPVPANMTPQILNCTNNGQVTIGGAATGGTNFTYLWNNGSTSPTQTVTTPSTYVLTVTNTDNGCTQTKDVAITEDKVLPTVNAGPDLTINCTNPTATASATASGGTSLTYAWTGAFSGGSSLTPTFNAGGTYALTVTNSVNGCKKVDDITVTADLVQPTAVAVSSNNINCTTTTATLNVTGSSSGANFTYGWTGPGGFTNSTASPSITVGGTYNLTVTNSINGCTKTATVNVLEDKALPNAGVNNTPVLTCTNPTIQLAGTGSTGGNFTYNWQGSAGGTITGGGTTLTPTVSTAGTYTLTVTNTTNGCTKTAVVNVTEDKVAPVVTATGGGTITCTNPSLSLGATVTSGSSLQYQWTTVGGAFSGNVNQQNVNVTQGGTYNLLATNTVNGCTVTSSVNVVANNTLPTANATASGTIDCNNTTVTLDGSTSSSGANYTFSWTGSGTITGGSTLTPTVTQGGNYTLSITNTTNGCVSSKTIVVAENKLAPSVSIPQPNALTCTASTVNISASSGAGNLYSWTATGGGNIVGSTTSSTITADKVGNYSVNVINPTNGCQATQSVSVIDNKLLPTATIAAPTAITCTAPNVTLNAVGSSSGLNFQIFWTSNPGAIGSGQGTLQPTVSVAGTYTLKITDSSNGCEKSATVSVVDNKALPTAQLAQVGDINCINKTYTLDGSGSSAGANFGYFWQLSGGANIVSGQSSLSPLINKGGTYTLVVTDNTNSCTATKTINVAENKTKPNASAGPNKVITCTSNSVTLQGAGSSGGQYQIQWYNNGGNIPASSGGNTYTPTVTQTGNYFLSVLSTVNGCADTTSTSVALDQGVPVANAGSLKELTCIVSTATLDGTGSTTGANLTVSWTTVGGAFTSPTNILQPTVNKAGTYSLQITNTTNGCVGNASVQVVDNQTKPSLKVAKPTILNCATPTQILNGGASSTGTNFTYLWTTANGTITAGSTTLQANINKQGDYILTIKNAQNGCQKDSTIKVLENFNTPTPSIATPDLLTCVKPTVTLNATASTKIQNAKITWKSSVPNTIVSGANTLSPIVNDEATYKLILTDTLSKCKDSITVEVKKDANIPQANAGAPTQLNCTVKTATLNGVASSGANISYAWTTVGGSFVGVTNTLTPTVNSAGKYTLKVTNSANQCIKESTVDITQDTIKPLAKIAKPAILNCKNTVLSINGTASSSGANIQYTWTTPPNSVVSGNGTASLLVKAPGVFNVLVTNTTNTCSATSQVTVNQDIVKPQATIAKSDTLNCKNAIVKLNGSASANSGFYTFVWIPATPTSIVKDGKTLSPTVKTEGNYQLEVIDTVNYCKTTAQLTVIKDVQTPVVDAGNGGNLTCTIKDLLLTGTASNGNAKDFIYTWTTKNGNIVGATNVPIIKSDSPGKYYFEVENKVNGCKAKDSTSVSQDSNVPKVEVLSNGDLDCKNKILKLDGSGSSQGAGFSYTWTTSNGGTIVGPTDVLIITVNSKGTYTLSVKNSANNCIKSIDKTIQIDTLKPVINVAQEIITCKKPVIELSGKVFQVNNYSLLWSTTSGTIVTPKTDTLQIQVSKKGIYNLTVKNKDNECTSTKIVDVLEDTTKPIADAGTALEINCKDSLVTLQGDKSSKGADFVYNWTPKALIVSGETTLNPVVDKAAVYTLQVNNKNNGCQNMATIDIKVNKTLPTIVFATPDTLTCKKQSLSVFADAKTTGNATYTWTGGNITSDKTKATVTLDQPATYNVVVFDEKNKCSSKKSIAILQDTIKPKVNAGADIELNCKKPTLDILGTATAKQSLTYNWTTNVGTIVSNGNKPTVTVKGQGIYTLNVTNNVNGCVSKDVMEVTFLGAPKAVVAPPQSLTCEKAAVLLDSKGSDSGANFTYDWTNSSNVSLGTSSTLSIAQPGTYTFKVANSTNECEQKVQVEVKEDKAKPIANAGPNDVIDCAKGYVILNGKKSSQGANFTYSWTGGLIDNGANTATPQVSAQAVYTLLVKNTDNGCTSTDTVGVTSLKPALLETVSQEAKCNGGKGSIFFKTISGGTPPYFYSINAGKSFATNATYNGLKAGEYIIAVKDSKGCEDSSSVTLNDPDKLVISLPLINAVKIGKDIQLQATVSPSNPPLKSIKWSPDSLLSCSDCLNPTVKKPLKSIYFTLKVINENGCEASTSTTVDVDRIIGVFVPNQFSPNGDNINDKFVPFADIELVKNVTWMRIFDRWGNELFEEKDIKPNDIPRGWDGQFRGQDVLPGVYLWNLEVEFIDGRKQLLKGDVTVHR